MLKRWFVKRRWLVLLEATTYTRIYGQQQLGKCLCVVGNQPTRKKFVVKIIFAQNIFVRFLCTKIFLQRNKSELWYNSDIQVHSLNAEIRQVVHRNLNFSDLP